MYLLDFDQAFDRMRERASQGEDARRLALATSREPDRSPVRRQLALALATVSRVSAGGVRRLDACLADDLDRRLAPTR